MKRSSSLLGSINGKLFLPCLINGSSATVLNDVLFNIGGAESTNSVCWLDLLSEKATWNSVNTLGVADFSDHCYRDATVVKNKIVYFGESLWNRDQGTYVLEQKEGDRGDLEVKFWLKAIDYQRDNP